MTPLQKHERIAKAVAMLKGGANVEEVRTACGYACRNSVYHLAVSYNLTVKPLPKKTRTSGTIAVTRRRCDSTKGRYPYSVAMVRGSMLRAAGLENEAQVAFTCEPGKITLTRKTL